jgi:coenzyme PQQ synthesis protein D (PqqD)
MKMVRDSLIVASKAFSSNVGDDMVIAGLQRGNYYRLSSVGARVWQLIQSPITPAEVGSVIAAEYDVNPERCEKDLLDLLKSMLDEGLIEMERAHVP